MKRLRRLHSLSVHEVSLVKAPASGHNFLIRKNKDGSPMPTAESIRQQLLNVPTSIVKSIEDVAKAAGDKDGATEESMAALKAAGRILAPHAESLKAEQVTGLMKAIGMMAQDAQQDDDEDEQLAQSASTATNKAADEDDEDEEDEDDEDDANVQKSNFDEGKHPRSQNGEFGSGGGGGKMPKGVIGVTSSGKVVRADGEQNENYTKKDHKEAAAAHHDALSDAKGEQRQVHMDALRHHQAMARRPGISKSEVNAVSGENNLSYPSQGSDDRAPTPLESAVAKSAGIDLKGFTEAQRAALEPILKSQAEQAEATERLREQHKEAIAKSAALQHKLDRKEFVQKAAAFPHLGTADALGERLHNLHQKDPEGYESWVGILKSANAASANSPLFRELGSSQGALSEASDKLNAAVTDIIQKSAATMTREKAESEYFKTPAGKKVFAELNHTATRSHRGV